MDAMGMLFFKSGSQGSQLGKRVWLSGYMAEFGDGCMDDHDWSWSVLKLETVFQDELKQLKWSAFLKNPKES